MAVAIHCSAANRGACGNARRTTPCARFTLAGWPLEVGDAELVSPRSSGSVVQLMAAGVLYLSYDGMLEPLGQSQVLAYLEKLAPGRRIHLISYEKAEDWSDVPRRSEVAARIAAAGIRWHPLRYHKAPSAPATAYDVAVGTALAIRLSLQHRLRIVHARSYVAGLIALAVKRATRVRFLFDMRGLWADERLDGGIWPDGSHLYRVAKKMESRLLKAADHVVTLTHASEAEIRRFSCLGLRPTPVSVIPTCADLDRFKIQGPPQRTPFVLGYLGSVGTWYLLDEMLRTFRFLLDSVPDARLLIINRQEQELIRQRIASMDVEPVRAEIVAADHDDVPALIGRMTVGMALIRPAYSKIASAPTKLAEYLGCGVPCFGNSGVGDMKSILGGRRVGVVIDGFSDEELKAGVNKAVELTHEQGLQDRCRQAALELFSLEQGVAAYDRVYDELIGSADGD